MSRLDEIDRGEMDRVETPEEVEKATVGGRDSFSVGNSVYQEDNVTVITAPFVAKITEINGDEIKINQSWSDFKSITGYDEELTKVNQEFTDVEISKNISNKRALNTYVHFGDDNIKLTTNAVIDTNTVTEYPNSTIFKLYEPLPDDIEEKDKVYVVQEILPQLTEEVELIPYQQEDENVTVLRPVESSQVDSPISQRRTKLQSYNDLITDDSRLQKDIVDKFISGSEKPVELNVDYSDYKNFVNFSSAEKRLGNFKYKLQQIESYTQQSSSLVGVTGSEKDLKRFDNLIRDTKNNFDGYESYLYNVSSSFVSSSLGVFNDSSVPKTGSGTYADPFKPVSSSATSFTNWYGSVNGKVGQVYTASLYDNSNQNRLVNLLPRHVSEDIQNSFFLDFMDMVGQHFDELWLYTKAISDITDRQNDLSDGFSKDLLFNLAASLGWSINDGKDLLDLSRVGFGQKLSGTTYSLYTSGSLDSPPEGDISKEITKRLISSMPYILKSKGTIGSLKAILNCYGIPSSILRVREYGGLQKSGQESDFEILRKFTKALGFRASQYVETPWENDSVTNIKPQTVELRFRAVSGSDQVLVQKDSDWAIKLKDNNSVDNKGRVSFMLSGSNGYKEISSSLLPVYDGEFHSVMLRKSKIDTELMVSSSFETPTNIGVFNPFRTALRGTLEIVSGSDVSFDGSKSLRHVNTSLTETSYTEQYFGENSSVATVSAGESYLFSIFAKVSSSIVDSVGSVKLFELDSNNNVVNWTEEFDFSLNDGGIKSSEKIGLDETEWRQIQVKKTIKFPNTSRLGVRLENNKPKTTIFWDEMSLRKVSSNSDTIADSFRYDLFVKKYDAGLDRIKLSSKVGLIISSSVSESYNAAWTGSGDLFIGGNNTTPFGAGKLSGSMMEFRLWSEPLDEDKFDNHVATPKSYIGNNVTSSFTTLVRRFAFDDNKTLASSSSIRDTRPNQTTTQSGSANHFGGSNTFESVIDKTKTIVPNSGPNRRMATKIRIEDNYLSGSGATLNVDKRYGRSANDYSPLDSPRLGVYFSPTDVVNEDIISSFANLDFNDLLGDPRDNFSQNYRELKSISDKYFQKYTGNNNFFDYLRLIKFYDQSVFKQLRKVIPARAKTTLGTLVEGNIFERPKSPVQRNNPSFTKPFFEDKVNLSNFEAEHEDSRSVVIPTGDFRNFTGVTDNTDVFLTPSLYRLVANDNYDDRNIYISSSVTHGGPNFVFSEATSSVFDNNRKSVNNKEYKFFYTSSVEFDLSDRKTTNLSKHFYSSKSLVETDLDPEYDLVLSLNRSFYEGVKNTKDTTIDKDSPIVVRTTAPTVAVPFDAGDSNLRVIDND
tara:strand:- start:1772 stop:5776 length:4005 start_codon:yes stop_codon:yes gene_type:complete